MRSKLTHNLGWKILSLFVAFILWLVIVNMADPTTTRTFNGITVDILNENVITDVNRVYEVISGDKVNVTVKGKRSIVDSIDESNFRATADLSELSSVNAVAINVNLINVNRTNVELNWDNAVLKVTLEKKISKKFKVDVKPEGELDSSFVLGEVYVQPNIIEVSGGKSKVNKIARVGVVVQLEGKTEDFKSDLTPILYDTDGKVINDQNIIFGEDTVRVTTNILPTKTVPVYIDVIGTPQDGYRIVRTDFQPETITVSGKKDDLATLERITIPLTVGGAKKDVEREMTTSDWLDRKYTPTSGFETISIRCIIEKDGARTFNLTNSDIKVNNVSNGLNFSFVNTNDKYEVKINGLENELIDITMESLGAYIDLDGYGEGVHTVYLQYDLPTGIKTKSKVKVKINLTPVVETE